MQGKGKKKKKKQCEKLIPALESTIFSDTYSKQTSTKTSTTLLIGEIGEDTRICLPYNEKFTT